MTEGAEIKAIQKKLWETETEILDAINEVCVKNNLRYSLAYGTLLGAVRHKGFIPWDDDIDIMMPREDYDKLIEIWDTVAPDGYILQNDNEINNFIKIRKDHTAFLQFESERQTKQHKGVFVDIFPADHVAPGKIRKKLQYLLFAVNLLFNRGYASKSRGMVAFFEKFLLKIVRKKNYIRVSKCAGLRSRRWNNYKQSEWVFPCTISDCKRFYPAELFNAIEEIEFQEKKYCAVRIFDAYLAIRYGDYMKLPPEEERVWKHHPILIDFEHNYEELVEEGKV